MIVLNGNLYGRKKSLNAWTGAWFFRRFKK